MDADGVEEDPNGEAMREIPSRRLWWNVTEWITETGTLRKRFYNPASQEWSWGEVVVPVYVRDRMGYRIRGQFRTIEHAIALAWVPRQTSMTRLRPVVLRDPSQGIIAHNIRYADQADVEEELSSDEESDNRDIYGELWIPLACKIGVVPCRECGLQVSNFGRIRHSSSGLILRSFLAIGNFCRVPNIGLIPMDATRALFGKSRTEKPPPRIRNLLILLKNSEDISIDALAARLKLKKNTVWTYVHQAMRYVSSASAGSIIEKLLCKPFPLEHAMRDIVSRNPSLLTTRLTPLVEIVTHELAGDPDWRCNPFRYAEVSALRMLLQREV